MGTSTRKIRQGGDKTSTQAVGRRGGATRTIHAQEFVVPEVSMGLRRDSFIIDLVFVIVMSEFLYFREIYHVYDATEGTFTARVVPYCLFYFLFNIIPLRFFGQTLGMKIRKVKMLAKSDLEYLKFGAIFQRQTVGMLFNISLGLSTLLKNQKLMSDELFNSVITPVVIEKKEERKIAGEQA